MPRINPKELKCLWTSGRTLGLDEGQIRIVVKNLTGKTSTRALTSREAIRVITWFRTGGDMTQISSHMGAPSSDPKVIPLATPRQIKRIEDLSVMARWDRERLMRFVQTNFKRDDLRKLRRKEAGALIHILDDVIRKNEGEE